MKQWLQTRTKPTVHLTLSYLAIIVAASLAYSVVMYNVTARQLVLQLRQPDGTQRTIIGPTENVTVPSSSSIGLQGKKDLKQNLILLNIAVIILGVPFCYVLARRTLRPIEEAMDSQTRFSSDAAHELRTPVAALRVRNEVALRNTKLTLAQAKDVIQSSIDQTARLEHLSEALLQLSQHDRVTKTAVHLEDVANEALNIHVEQAQAKDITITDEVSDVTAYANRQDIVQVVSILLDNAIKYSPDHSCIVITGGKDAGRAWLCVHDHGVGIRATDRKHIFERFYRADHARSTSPGQSYGLGLSIAQKLMAQNSGTISVESTVGKGAAFTLSLPLS